MSARTHFEAEPGDLGQTPAPGKDHIRCELVGNTWCHTFRGAIIGVVGRVGHCINARRSHFPGRDGPRVVEIRD